MSGSLTSDIPDDGSLHLHHEAGQGSIYLFLHIFNHAIQSLVQGVDSQRAFTDFTASGKPSRDVVLSLGANLWLHSPRFIGDMLVLAKLTDPRIYLSTPFISHCFFLAAKAFVTGTWPGFLSETLDTTEIQTNAFVLSWRAASTIRRLLLRVARNLRASSSEHSPSTTCDSSSKPYPTYRSTGQASIGSRNSSSVSLRTKRTLFRDYQQIETTLYQPLLRSSSKTFTWRIYLPRSPLTRVDISS